MKLYYHRPARANVGDDLNAVIWREVFPEYPDFDMADWLIGAGTILDRRLHALPGQKLVVGAGYRPGQRTLRFGRDVFFAGVRGKLSAARLGLAPDRVACDPAFVFARHATGRSRTSGDVGFVPHIYSEERTGIAAAAAAAGLEVISPGLAPGEFVRRLDRCARVYCEAMHGAILADALRVPWARVRVSAHFYEGDGVNDFKWRDAFSVLGVDVTPVNQVGLVPLKRSWPAMGVILQPVQILAENRLASLLYRLRDAPLFQLSAEARLLERVDDFFQRVDRIRDWEAAQGVAAVQSS